MQLPRQCGRPPDLRAAGECAGYDNRMRKWALQPSQCGCGGPARRYKEIQMAHVQSYFEQFHKVIRADYDMNATLREKRDIVLGMVSDYLKGRRYPAFSVIHQGSYKMRTGVKPIGAWSSTSTSGCGSRPPKRPLSSGIGFARRLRIIPKAPRRGEPASV